MNGVDIIFELLDVSVGHRKSLSEIPGDEQWKEAFIIAEKHSIVGVLAPALDIIDNSQRPKRNIYLPWQFFAEKIKAYNTDLINKSKVLYKTISQDGPRSCIIKGPAFARYYDNSLLRQSGDIDIWVEGGCRNILEYLSRNYTLKDIFYHHCSIKFFNDTKVEVHFMPSWMNSPRLNRRLQQYYKHNEKEQFSNYDETLGFCIPTATFSCIHAFIHTFRHLFQEGVGLRQVMDCYQLLISLDEEERKSVAKILKHLGLKKFTSAMMYILCEVFGLESDKYLFNPDAKEGSILLKDIIQSGNFGIYNKESKKLYSKNTLVRSISKISRISNICRFCYQEALWAPYFKIWQKIWRRL